MLAPGNVEWDIYLEAPKIYQVRVEANDGSAEENTDYNRYDVDFMISHFNDVKDILIWNMQNNQLVYQKSTGLNKLPK